MKAPSHSRPPGPWSLRRADQAAVGGLVLVALLALAGYWWSHGGSSGRLIEIEREPPRTARYLVDINSADWPELAQVPGIGEGLARRIVEDRSRVGPYIDHDDLRRVRGIGPKTLDEMRPFLRPLPPAAGVAGR